MAPMEAFHSALFFINSSLFSIFHKFQATFCLSSWIYLDLLRKHMTSLKQIQNTPSRTSLNAMYVYVMLVCLCAWVGHSQLSLVFVSVCL